MAYVNGKTKGAPEHDRPWVSLRNEQPDVAMQKIRMAARMRVEGQSWVAVARTSGIPYNTLKAWAKQTDSKSGKIWLAVLQEEHAKAGLDRQGEPVDAAKPYEVSTEGFQSPQALAKHWSLEATKIQIQTMLDREAPRKERLESSKRIQDLAGDSPVSKSIVITAPIDDQRVAAALWSVLEEVKQLSANPPKLIEAQDAEFTEAQ